MKVLFKKSLGTELHILSLIKGLNFVSGVYTRRTEILVDHLEAWKETW